MNANRLWVDSRLRAFTQRHVEAAALRRLGGPVPGGRVLEIGTGRRGTGLGLAVTAFGAATVDGVDLYPASAAAAEAATRDLSGRVTVQQGDATRLDAPEGTYDAVFCYHLLHHAERWRDAVAEAARVLRPGGLLYVSEMTARFVDSRTLRAVSFHPADGDRPTERTLAQMCATAGLTVVGQRTRLLGTWTALVARKA